MLKIRELCGSAYSSYVLVDRTAARFWVSVVGAAMVRAAKVATSATENFMMKIRLILCA